MRVLVYEFVSGGGLRGQARPASLAREGTAMLGALLQDLAALPELEVTTTLEPRARVRIPPGVRVAPGGDSKVGLRALLRQCDAAWLIAPEAGGALARLARLAEAEGVPLLGSGAAAIRRCSDKAWLARRLRHAGIATPLTVPVAAGGDAATAAEVIGYPVVVKPARGAGCGGVGLAGDPAELARAVSAARTGTEVVLLQQFLPGTHASVAVLASEAGTTPLCASLQLVEPGARFRYRGGETPLHHPLAERACERATVACRLVPGLRGWVGVDLVLGDHDAAVIEINPRLTTSYLGARAAMDVNVAALAIGACLGKPAPPPPAAPRRVRFDANGTVQLPPPPAT